MHMYVRKTFFLLLPFKSVFKEHILKRRHKIIPCCLSSVLVTTDQCFAWYDLEPELSLWTCVFLYWWMLNAAGSCGEVTVVCFPDAGDKRNSDVAPTCGIVHDVVVIYITGRKLYCLENHLKLSFLASSRIFLPRY